VGGDEYCAVHLQDEEKATSGPVEHKSHILEKAHVAALELELPGE